MVVKYWCDEDFIKIVKESRSGAEVLRYFGLPDQQGYYRQVLKQELQRLAVSTSHFEYRAPVKKPLKEILVKGSTYRGALRKRLVKAGLLKEICAKCSTGPSWQGFNLVLHLDHINGDHTDNRMPNLRLLCPNCHSQTETYCGANKREGARKRRSCAKCGGVKAASAKLCRGCTPVQGYDSGVHPTKIAWPSATALAELVRLAPLTHVAKQLGVSDKALKKRCLKLGVSTKPRGAWSKPA